MTYTDNQLKLALVKALPDRLCISSGFGSIMWKPQEIGALVTEHEWPAIVGMVEDALPEWQMNQYAAKICDCHIEHFSPIIIPLIKLKWQTRAIALVEIGAIKVETP